MQAMPSGTLAMANGETHQVVASQCPLETRICRERMALV